MQLIIGNPFYINERSLVYYLGFLELMFLDVCYLSLLVEDIYTPSILILPVFSQARYSLGESL